MYSWLKPVPFWKEANTEQGEDLIRPVLLEFQSDAFMEDFLVESDTADPRNTAELEKRVLIPESAETLKLFQPAHGRYYLVCASLCCRDLGFPDREIRKGDGESIFFVVRKLIIGTNGAKAEYGWTVDGKAKSWQTVTDKTLLEKEERLPLFTTAVCCSRRMAYGYIPVASGETYQQEITISNATELAELDRRMLIFNENISQPLQQLSVGVPPNPILEQMSLFLLCDLADFLSEFLPDVWDVIRGTKTESQLTPTQKTLFQQLGRMTVSDGTTNKTVTAALNEIRQNREQIDRYDGTGNPPFRYRITINADWQSLQATTQAALPPADTTTPQTQTAEVSKNTVLSSPNFVEKFIVRCVYERPCDAPFPPRRWFSQATHPFVMAAFFDVDAPARPIRIELPTDTSIAAMRKFKKGVGFVISNSLRNKMEMIVGKEKTILKDGGVNGEGGWSLGMLCQLSIPIITLCAFILLFVLVFVLNIVFWWVPFFRICLPIPKKGK